jgi:hypothetical protein
MGGNNGPSYHVNIRDGKLLYRHGLLNPADIQWEEWRISDQELASLLRKLRDLGVENWKDSYIDEKVSDGTRWQVEIRTREIQKTIYGSNKFPENFDKLRQYISDNLLKGRDFH